MRQKIYCAVENDLQIGFKQKFEDWGFEPHFISVQDNGNMPDEVNLLPKEEAWLERWAERICQELPPEDENPVLLIQAELSENLPAAQGIFLAELVWRKRVLPTIIAVIDLQAGQYDFSRRARYAGEKPVLPIITPSGTSSEIKPSLVLWDFLTDETQLRKAIKRAARFVAVGVDNTDLQRTIINAIVAEQSATYRHRMGSLQASLRIMEGVYRWGWIDIAAVTDFIEVLETQIIEEGDNLRLRNLELFAEAVKRFDITPSNEPAPKESFLEILICDDDLEKSGWKFLISKLVEKKLGLKVQGFTFRNELEKYLDEKQDDNRIVSVLLDVDYKLADSNRIESVDEKYLHFLHDKYRLLDVILFTAKLNDGSLVREAYKLGYGFFFKELDQPMRKPKEDAEKFFKTLDRSVSSYTIRALQNLAAQGVVDTEAGDEINNLLFALRTWKQNPHSSLALQLPPLLEQQYRNCCRITCSKNWGAGKDIQWTHLTTRDSEILTNPLISRMLDVNLKPLQSWKRIWELAKFARHTTVHTPSFLLDESSLPAIGISAPLIVGITLLHQIILTKQQGLENVVDALDMIYKAVLKSNRFIKSDAFDFFENAVINFSSRNYRTVFDDCAVMIDKNKKIFGTRPSAISAGSRPPKRNLALCLLDETYFFDPGLEIHGTLVDCSDSLTCYRLLHVLLVSCLLDHPKSVF